MYNALTRFFVYLTLIYLLFSDDASYVLVPVLAILAIMIFYYSEKKTLENFACSSLATSIDTNNYDIFDNNDAHFDSIEQCQEPNINNPFMNVTLEDLMSDRTRPPACSVMDENIHEQINDNPLL